ncbi:MAG: hypothetical protein ACMUIS_12000 [bacterium]
MDIALLRTDIYCIYPGSRNEGSKSELPMNVLAMDEQAARLNNSSEKHIIPLGGIEAKELTHE